jgi:CRP-like cAMP-binding protein
LQNSTWRRCAGSRSCAATIERDGFVFREGEEAAACSLILEGCVFRQKVVRSGARQIISFHFPGEFIDLQNCLLAVNDHGVQALGTCSLAVVPRKALLALVEQRPALARAAWFETLLDGAIYREWVVNIGRRNARARIAHLLCELAIRLDSTTETAGLSLAADAGAHRRRNRAHARAHQPHDPGLAPRGPDLVLVRSAGGARLATLRTIGDFSEFYLHRAERRSSGH